MKKYILFLFLILMLLLILILPSDAFNGALSGLNLWLYVVVPTILPFLIVTEILKKINGIELLSYYPSRFISPLLKISSCSSYAVISGLLCGYPIGAKIIYDLYSNSKISYNEACYLLTFVNNPSPIFLISYIFTSNLKGSVYPVSYIILFYSAILATAIIMRIIYNFTPDNITRRSQISLSDSSLIDNSIINSFEIIIRIGGYIIIFSIIARMLAFNISVSAFYISIITGLLEITGGINNLSFVNITDKIATISMCSLASLGGLCTLMQIHSVCPLPLKNVIAGKLCSTLIFIILCIILI